MDLVSFDSKNEETHFFNLLAVDSFYHNVTLHIGATKMNSDDFYWMKNGEPVNYELNWAEYHPWFNMRNYNCLSVANVTSAGQATYVDGDCDKIHHEFACEQYSH